MTGEPSWTECATQVMEGKEQLWFTVQAIVTAIRQSNIKPSMHRLPSNEACRSLRSCLRHHARKDNGRFIRKHDASPLIQYALRKGVYGTSSQMKHNSTVTQLIDSSPPSSPTSNSSIIVEIDDPNIHKPYRPRHPRDWTQPGFLLPSPSHSILGPQRTLTLMTSQGEPIGRPVRKTRGRLGQRARERTNTHNTSSSEDYHIKPTLSLPSSMTSITVLDELYSVPSSHDCHVTFLKSAYVDDTSCAVKITTENRPTHIQGDRQCRIICDVDPNACVNFDLTSSSDNESETCTEDETTPPNDITSNTSQPTPLVETSHDTLSHHKPVTMPTINTSRRSEVTRQLTHLLSPSSPLIGENLEGMSSFERLSLADRRQMTSLLPNVDSDPNGRIQPVALSNSFFGSACREWQDHLMLGLHGNTGGRRIDKKNRNHGDTSWKDKFFETTWGERSHNDDEDDETMFFPHDSDYLSNCLHAILNGYQPRHTTSQSPPLSATSVTNVEKKLLSKPSTSFVNEKGRPLPRYNKQTISKRPTTGITINNKHFKSLINKKGFIRNHHVLSNKNQSNRSMYLSPLPHKMSYAALIAALHKASRNTTTTTKRSYTPTPSSSSTLHNHSVYLDHFSTLHASSVPMTFLSPSSSLIVSLPRSLHTTLLIQRSIQSDHNYTPLTATLPLSLPRSLLMTSSSTIPSSPHTFNLCFSQRLTLCSTCNSLYHVNCSHGNLCPSCVISRSTSVT